MEIEDKILTELEDKIVTRAKACMPEIKKSIYPKKTKGRFIKIPFTCEGVIDILKYDYEEEKFTEIIYSYISDVGEKAIDRVIDISKMN